MTARVLRTSAWYDDANVVVDIVAIDAGTGLKRDIRLVLDPDRADALATKLRHAFSDARRTQGVRLC